MRWDFEKLAGDAEQEISSCADLKSLEAVRVKFLGRKGLLTNIYASLPTLSAEEKPLVGAEAAKGSARPKLRAVQMTHAAQM